MNAQDAREKIKKLAETLARVEIRAMNENRALTAEEDSLCREMEGSIKALKDLLPQNPLSQPGAHLTGFSGGRRTSGGAFNSLGEQLNAVIRAGMPGGEADRRLYNAATGLGESVSSDGGFLVQSDFSYDLLKEVFNTGILAKLCWNVELSGNSNRLELPAYDETSRAAGSRFGGARGYWVDEAEKITASKPKFRKLELNLHKLAGLCYLTEELMSDVKILEQVVARAFTSELGFMIDDAILNGTGAGQNLGVMNSGGLVTASKLSGQSENTFLYENAISMWRRLLPGSRKNAVWLISPDLEDQLYTMSLATGTGGSAVFLPSGGASDAPYATLFSRPIVTCEMCQQLGTAGDIVLADFSNGYVLATKGGIASQSSVHVRFEYDEQIIKWVLRLDGQPVLASPVTPANGGDTLGHFVALETR